MKSKSKVYWLSKGSVVDNPDLTATSILMDLGALDSVDYFADGQTRFVVATEDSDKEPLRTLLLSNGFVEEDTEIASYTGCTKVDAALVLGGFLREKAPHVRLVVHRDSDHCSAGSAAAFVERLTQAGVLPFVTEHSDVEGYFLNAAHLHTLNPTVTADRIQELIEQATTDCAQQSVEAIINQRTAEAIRDRREGGGAPNHGQIGTQAHADYIASPATMRRGKKVLGRLIGLLQQELGQNPRIFFPTTHMQSNMLKTLVQSIWPAG